MDTEVSISYLTGSAKVIKNMLFTDEIIKRERRPIKSMLFQPYEDKKEFIYCARHTVLPLVIVGVMAPIELITVSIILIGSTVALQVLGEIVKLCRKETDASFLLDAGTHLLEAGTSLLKDFCQALIDLAVLPLSALAMLTRGISTGLQAVTLIGQEVAEEVPSVKLP